MSNELIRQDNALIEVTSSNKGLSNSHELKVSRDLDFFVNTHMFDPKLPKRDFMQILVSENEESLQAKTLDLLKLFLQVKQDDIKNDTNCFTKPRVLIVTDTPAMFQFFFKKYLNWFVENGTVHFFEKSADDPVLDAMKFKGKYDFIILHPLVPDIAKHIVPMSNNKPNFFLYVMQHLKTNPDVAIFATCTYSQYKGTFT